MSSHTSVSSSQASSTSTRRRSSQQQIHHGGSRQKSQHQDSRQQSQYRDSRQQSQHSDSLQQSQHSDSRQQSQHPDSRQQSHHDEERTEEASLSRGKSPTRRRSSPHYPRRVISSSDIIVDETVDETQNLLLNYSSDKENVEEPDFTILDELSTELSTDADPDSTPEVSFRPSTGQKRPASPLSEIRIPTRPRVLILENDEVETARTNLPQKRVSWYTDLSKSYLRITKSSFQQRGQPPTNIEQLLYGISDTADIRGTNLSAIATTILNNVKPIAVRWVLFSRPIPSSTEKLNAIHRWWHHECQRLSPGIDHVQPSKSFLQLVRVILNTPFVLTTTN